jgi:hypothetical protein
LSLCSQLLRNRERTVDTDYFSILLIWLGAEFNGGFSRTRNWILDFRNCHVFSWLADGVLVSEEIFSSCCLLVILIQSPIHIQTHKQVYTETKIRSLEHVIDERLFVTSLLVLLCIIDNCRCFAICTYYILSYISVIVNASTDCFQSSFRWMYTFN